jgi:TRAP-type C4-dicarboxylate transport system substrate-binding protein
MMKINRFPGAQLGQEPVMLQKLRSGDIDFIITSSANGATLSPELGVMSLHYLFKDEDHLAKAVASPELNDAIKQMVSDTVDGAHVLTLITLGFRNIYAKGRKPGSRRQPPRSASSSRRMPSNSSRNPRSS